MAAVAGLGKAQKKEFAWSYSKLKNFANCPKKYYEVDVAKNYAEAGSDDPNTPLNYGNRAHAMFAAALTKTLPDLKNYIVSDEDAGRLRAGVMPAEFKDYQPWVDRVLAGPGQLLVEQKYAITRDFKATTYFAKDVWYRGIGDVVRIDGPVALVLDWKAGKVLVDSVQLMLMAQCIFSHYPEVQLVRSEFVWLKDDCTTPEVFTRQEVADNWVSLMERVNALEMAHKLQDYPPKPSGLCKSWCPVVSCPYHGKGGRG